MKSYNEVLTKLNNGSDLFYDENRVAQIQRVFGAIFSIMIRLENETQFNRVHIRSLKIAQTTKQINK